MLTSSAPRLCLLTVVGALLAAASTAPAASAATQRYASPTGSANAACSSADPCSITKAVEGANSGDEVIVKPGDYTLTAPLDDLAQITIHGVAGQPRPALSFSGPGPKWLVVDQQGSTLRYVEIHQTGPYPALITTGATVDQVVAKGPGTPTVVNITKGTIRNSIVVASGTNARAIRTVGGTGIGSYRNVTAISTGSGGVAIEAYAVGAASNVGIHASNVIARGGPGGHSFVATTDNSGASATIAFTRSNWSDALPVGTNAAIVNGGANQGSAPAFVNAATGDYRQAAGSPTIGAGMNDPTNGTFDIDGDPRTIGTTDIGADEFVAAPAATTGPASAVTDESATLSGSVNPGGAPTTYHFEYGTTTAYGHTTSDTGAGSGTGSVAAAATIGGLSPETTYHFRVAASNAGGDKVGGDQTLTTTAAPTMTAPTAQPPAATTTSPTTTSATTTSAPTSSSATTPTPPPQGFAGVKLVSTRLTFRGKFITLRLRCPAGTVAGCTGWTTLTARGSSTSSRASSQVNLGRARFSIAPGRQARVKVRVSRAGLRRLSGARRLAARDINAARDGAGVSKTTRAAVTIRPSGA